MLKMLVDSWPDVFRGKGQSAKNRIRGSSMRKSGGATKPLVAGANPAPGSTPRDIQDAIDSLFDTMQKQAEEAEIDRAFWEIVR